MPARKFPFTCPGCGADRWTAVLMLPGGLKVTCGGCSWSEYAAEIDRRMKAGEL